MQNYKAHLIEHFSQFPLGEGCETTSNALEYLWQQYNTLFPEQDETVKKAELNMSAVYDALSLEETNKLFFLVMDLCNAYERAAFLNGIRVGAKLTMELYTGTPLP